MSRRTLYTKLEEEAIEEIKSGVDFEDEETEGEYAEEQGSQELQATHGIALKSKTSSKKERKKKEKQSKSREIRNMYEMILANFIAKDTIIEPSGRLGSGSIAIGFSNISSQREIRKYFMITRYPDYMKVRMQDYIRNKCLYEGVRINFYYYCGGYKINWDSPEMRNRLAIWKRYTADDKESTVFDYRDNKLQEQAKNRIVQSTRYLNNAEDKFGRSLMKVCIIVELVGDRGDVGISNLMQSVKALKSMQNITELSCKIRELRVNMIDWLRAYGVFSLRSSKEVSQKSINKVMTDDNMALFNSYRQGRVGKNGIVMAMDVNSRTPIIYDFKPTGDGQGADNMLICAETGGGKSVFIKNMMVYMLCLDKIGTSIVLDYEGDEYSGIAYTLLSGNTKDVVIVSMGKDNTEYYDPCPIPRRTGNEEVDGELKNNAKTYIESYFRVMASDGEDLTLEQKNVLSVAITRMYESAGVVDDPETWDRSRNMRLKDVYYEIKQIVDRKEYADYVDGGEKHKAAKTLKERTEMYFEEGGSKSSAFGRAVKADDMYGAKMVLFSFGMKGADTSLTDPKVTAMKQIGVACICGQIANYNKYIKNKYTVIYWEEFQRWIRLEGSSGIVQNIITGGRKRGIISAVITNEISNIISEEASISSTLKTNTQHFFIGRIADSGVRKKFCEIFGLQNNLSVLEEIAKANEKSGGGRGTRNRYRHAFFMKFGNGQEAVGRVELPPELMGSNLFSSGITR